VRDPHASVDGYAVVRERDHRVQVELCHLGEVVRQGGEAHALADRCSHRGCSLAEGELGDGVVRCKCHGSTFRLDGSIVSGPATSPQPALEVRVESAKIEVRTLRNRGADSEVDQTNGE
jgi:nitrite reductase/ring-hydroxylating ferredoxin subunit